MPSSRISRHSFVPPAKDWHLPARAALPRIADGAGITFPHDAALLSPEAVIFHKDEELTLVAAA